MIEIMVDDNSNFGINYYHESMGYLRRTDDELRMDLTRIKKITNKIKLFKHPWGWNGYIKRICEIAKELDFYVILGINFEGNPWVPPYPESPYQPTKYLTEEMWLTYCDYVKADYTLCKDYIDEFLISNEITIHTDGTDGMVRQPLIDKVAALKIELEAIQSCIFGIQSGCWTFVWWTPLDFSAFDKLYFTIYSKEENRFREITEQMIGLYPNAGFGEWNIDFSVESITDEELKAKAEKQKTRKDWLKEQKIPNFLFTYGHDKYHKVTDNFQFNNLAKTIHYCDHDEDISQRRGCDIRLEDNIT